MSVIRTAVVTGGMSGLGKAAAGRLADDGVHVITFDIAGGPDLQVDVTDAAAVRAAADQVGPVDILINSAGIVGPNAPLWEIPLDGLDAVRRQCARHLHTSRHSFPACAKRVCGRIVHMPACRQDGNPNIRLFGVRPRHALTQPGKERPPRRAGERIAPP